MKWRNAIIATLILAFVGITVWYAWPQMSQTASACLQEKGNNTRIEKGACAPNFTLTDTGGASMELYQNDGKPTFINFWASWCEPCQAELPYMQTAYTKYKNQIHFMMVNATVTEASQDDVMKFIKDKRYTFPVYMDTDKTNIALGKYRVPGIPVTVIVNADGTIMEKVVGTVSESQMKHLLSKMLAGKERVN